MMSLNNFLWVFLGGGLGSVIRFVFSMWVSKSAQDSIPYSTLMANIAACILMAIAMRFISPISESTRLFLFVGFCGGLSTFSTFSMETVSMIKYGQFAWAIGNILLNVCFCFGILFFTIRK